jgi:hypothetical protein
VNWCVMHVFELRFIETIDLRLDHLSRRIGARVGLCALLSMSHASAWDGSGVERRGDEHTANRDQ